MADDLAEFKELIKQVRDGSQEAAWDLIEHYSPQIFRVVRRRLPPGLRRKFDSQDFVQAAWASVFAHRSCFDRIGQPQDFIAFMAAVAANKVGMEVRRRLHGQKYNIQREEQLYEESDSAAGGDEDVPARDPSPSQVAVARERWFQLLEEQPAHYRQIIQLRYDGATMKEIADRLGFDESTVRRAVRKILKEQGL